MHEASPCTDVKSCDIAVFFFFVLILGSYMLFLGIADDLYTIIPTYAYICMIER